MRQTTLVEMDENRARRPASRALPRDVLVIGDSLAVDFGPALKRQLRGWRVRIDARIGRSLGQGMSILARRSRAPAILAFSLFTNDSPRQISELERAVRATATRSANCAVWATIVRPPLNGRGYDATNRMLRALADESQLALGLQIVDWARAVAADRSLLDRDGVHATPAGDAMFARMYAAAIRTCAGEARER